MMLAFFVVSAEQLDVNCAEEGKNEPLEETHEDLHKVEWDWENDAAEEMKDPRDIKRELGG